LKVEGLKLKAQVDLKKAQMELMAEQDLNRAKIHQLEAQAILAMAQAEGVGKGHEIAMLEAQIGAAKAAQDSNLKMMEILQKADEAMKDFEVDKKQLQQAGVPPAAPA
jgi:hypothetical protein